MRRLLWTLSGAVIMAGPALAAAAAEGEHKPSVFAGTPAQSVAAVIVFLVLFGLLYKLAWGPILKGLQDREQKIRKDLEDAESAAKKAAATLAQLETRLAAAQAEARQLIDRSRGEAEKLAGQIKADAEREGLQLRQRAQKEIESATEQAVAQLHAEAAALATQVAGKILHRTINENDQRALVSEALAELSRGQGKN
ncbi:MAG: F0F1 ATP synthase subunit B [Phycisphaeraceae bacterium]|nr:F0F1 ATP synthase subunit B [Phycisphaeraceae bacterium]